MDKPDSDINSVLKAGAKIEGELQRPRRQMVEEFLEPGTAISHYRIIERLGAGGMGVGTCSPKR